MTKESRVKDILKQKRSREIFSIDENQLVYEAVRLMARHNIGALLVTRSGDLVGIITERDYARRVILEGKSSRATRVREIMDVNMVCAQLNDTAGEILSEMTTRRMRHMPVFIADKLIGLISMGDVVRAIIEDQQFMLEQMTQFVTGSYSIEQQVA